MNIKTTLCSYFLTVGKNYELNVAKITAQGFDASSKEPMKRYILHVFADGSEELIDIGGEAPSENEGACEKKETAAVLNNTVYTATARIYQTLMVLDYIRLHKDEHKKPNGDPNAENAVRAGIKYAAKQCGDLLVSTIMDKITRQMGVNIQFWRNMVDTWLKTDDFSLIEDFLIQQIDKKGNDRSRENDKAALKVFVDTL